MPPPAPFSPSVRPLPLLLSPTLPCPALPSPPLPPPTHRRKGPVGCTCMPPRTADGLRQAPCDEPESATRVSPAAAPDSPTRVTPAASPRAGVRAGTAGCEQGQSESRARAGGGVAVALGVAVKRRWCGITALVGGKVALWAAQWRWLVVGWRWWAVERCWVASAPRCVSDGCLKRRENERGGAGRKREGVEAR